MSVRLDNLEAIDVRPIRRALISVYDKTGLLDLAEEPMSVRLDNLDTIDTRPIRRALISVYDKTGLLELAAALTEAGVEIVSTGSTATRIAEAGYPVTPVDDVTGFPEVLEGRVKTLHPHVHAGILADQRKADHRQQIADLNIAAFDLVICNLRGCRPRSSR